MTKRSEMKYHDAMWATMEPDFHAGDMCDQTMPMWRCDTDGDKGDDSTMAVISLAANTFPPGTKVTIEVPVCPTCEESADCFIEETGRMHKCACGFDWNEWAAKEFG